MMLENLRAFWISTPPDPMIPFTLWRSFRQEVLGWMGGMILVGVALIVFLYAFFCRRVVIRTSLDPSAPFTPVRWLLLALVSGVAAATAYWVRYASLFRFAQISPAWGALTAFALTALATYVLAQLLIWIPGVTPRKIIYHPRWLWRLLR